MQEIKYPEYPHKKCLDRGFVALVDHMGNDARIVQAARVSYQKGTKAVSTDRHLIRYLLRNLHTTPLEKIRFEFHVKLPIFIARQWMRHRMGSFNEVSARYSVMPDEFYIPNPLRKQSETNRQGSSDEVVTKVSWPEFEGPEEGSAEDNPQEFIRSSSNCSYKDYELLMESGAARELARSVLPVNIYTEFYWTVDLWNLMHFLRLRVDGHAQKEIQEYGNAILNLIKENCDLPYAIEAFEDYILKAPNLTRYEVEAVVEILKEHGLMDEAIAKIKDNPQMSKRERKESKLVMFLERGQNDSEQHNQIDHTEDEK